jgi:hypothetical protein
VAEHEGLELDEDITQQNKVWVIERTSWFLIAGIVIAGMTGFLGHGPFSSRSEAPLDAGYTLDYQRFERHQSASQFTVRLMEEGFDGDIVTMRLGNAFLRKAEITAVEPEPDSVELDADFIVFKFRAAAAGDITFHFMPTGFGNMALDISIGERALQTHPQFVLP